MVHGIIVISLIKATKGLVHPKLKILSLITHPRVVDMGLTEFKIMAKYPF